MLGLIEQAQSLAEAQVREGATVEAASAEFGRHVGQLRAVMLQAGFTEDQVDALIAKYGQVPPMKKTAIIVTGIEAMQYALDIARMIFGLPSQKIITTTYVSRYTSTGQVPGGPYVRYAAGGPIRMAFAGPVPGTGSGDHVPVLAEPGEFMIRKSSAQKIGLPALTRMNAMASGGLSTWSRILIPGQCVGLVGRCRQEDRHAGWRRHRGLRRHVRRQPASSTTSTSQPGPSVGLGRTRASRGDARAASAAAPIPARSWLDGLWTRTDLSSTSMPEPPSRGMRQKRLGL